MTSIYFHYSKLEFQPSKRIKFVFFGIWRCFKTFKNTRNSWRWLTLIVVRVNNNFSYSSRMHIGCKLNFSPFLKYLYYTSLWTMYKYFKLYKKIIVDIMILRVSWKFYRNWLAICFDKKNSLYFCSRVMVETPYFHEYNF